jgi:hypothetical protein
MDARFYNSDQIDIERLARDLVNAYQAQGYQAQQIGTKDQMLVQLKRGGDFEAIIGMQAALSLNLQRTSGGVLATIGQQRWIDKAAVGAVGLIGAVVLWPLAITAGVGAFRQASMGNQVLNMVDGLVRQQVPSMQAGPIPYNVMPLIQQQSAPPMSNPFNTPPRMAPQGEPYYTPAPATQAPTYQPAPFAPGGQLRCANCNTPYEVGDTFCTGCGQSLTPPRLYCNKCNSEMKPGAAFCPKCGSSSFSAVSAQAQRQAPQTPPQTPAPMVTYKHTQPSLVPPPAQQQPPVPFYTPPATPTYTPPKQPSTPPPVPTQPAQVTNPVQPEPYVPPTTQTPQVVPQPKVTLTPGQKKETHAVPPPRPQKVYYTPSNQAAQQATNADQPTVPAQPAQPQSLAQDATQQQAPYYTPPSINTQPTMPEQPLQARPAPSVENTAPWGTLILSNGERVQLKGEHAVIGRRDHDIDEGLQADVDLSKQQGADTISRLHATIEHIGSTFVLTDLNSTNATRVNNKRLEPDKPTPLNDGDTLQFGKVTCTFKKL